MKTLITGISSDIGRFLAEHLVNHGHQVIGIDIKSIDSLPTEVEFVRGDVRDIPTLTHIAHECDTGIHLAVLSGNAPDLLDVNVSGAYSFMIAARANNFRNAILTSSAPVHLENIDIDALLLSTSQDEDHAYDLSKVLQEVTCRDFHTHGTPVMCLRLGHIVWGEREVNLSKPTPLTEFNYCRGGWVALEDVVIACAKALETTPDPKIFEILNIVGARGAREKFNIGDTEQRLGFELIFDFANFE